MSPNDNNKLKGRLSHIELYVSNLKKSICFWEWLLTHLGYALYQQWDSGRSWKKDQTYIVVVQTDDRHLHKKYHRCHTGLNHLAFYADSPDEVAEITRELRKRNVTILYEDRHPHAGGADSYAVYFEDPDRIKVEITVKQAERR